MANINKRISDLENETGGGGSPVVMVVWSEDGQPDPDQIVNVQGEKMTYAEFIKRYPDSETKTIDWPSDEG